MLELGMGAKLVPMIKVDESSIYSSQWPQKLRTRAQVYEQPKTDYELTATETRGILWVLVRWVRPLFSWRIQVIRARWASESSE